MGSIQRRIDQAFQVLPAAPSSVQATPGPTPVASPQAPAPSSDQVALGSSQGTSQTQIELSPPENPQSHTVGKGESLSTISKKYFGSANYYMEIYNLNRDVMKHPNHLSSGMVLKLPQHLFPEQAGGKPSVSPTASLSVMRQENPLSYLTMNRHLEESEQVQADSTHPDRVLPQRPILTGAFEFGKENVERWMDLDLFDADKPVANASGTKSIHHIDAVKVNKSFNLHPSLTPKNLASQTDEWASKVAEILKANHTTIQLPDGQGGSFAVDAQFMENLAQQVKDGKYQDVKNLFAKEKGIAFMNTLWAIDDVVSNLKSDPYYQNLKAVPKTIDLAAVGDDFNLGSDKLNYLAKTKAHQHKQVPVILEMDPATLNASASGNKSAEAILQDLTSHFDGKGNLKDPKGFETKVYALLNDSGARRALVEHFKLNSDDNLAALIPAMTAEGGMAASQIDYDSYFAVGSVMLNRALGRNLKNAAQKLAKGTALDKIRPVSMDTIIREKGQFEIVWRNLPGKSSTIYDYNKSLNQAFLNGRLNEGGTGERAFTLAYEVSHDLLEGMNRLQAEVDGVTTKGTGRSTAELFYFNQSRSRDHSTYASSAVELIDKNNTHVFFKEWGDIPYF